MDAGVFSMRLSQNINHIASERGGADLSPFSDLRQHTSQIEVVIGTGSVSVPVKRIGSRGDQVVIQPVSRLVPVWVLPLVTIMAVCLGVGIGVTLGAIS